MSAPAAKCWLVRDGAGKPVRINASPEFTLADLADDESIDCWPLDEAVALVLGHEAKR